MLAKIPVTVGCIANLAIHPYRALQVPKVPVVPLVPVVTLGLKEVQEVTALLGARVPLALQALLDQWVCRVTQARKEIKVDLAVRENRALVDEL